MFELKPLSVQALESAVAKAERYRLLNEPAEAESICRDILDVDADNQAALRMLTLALTDQIPAERDAFQEAVTAANRLADAYERVYYAGIAWERRAKARHEQGGRGCHHAVHDWIYRAMDHYAQAEALRPAGNDDSLLRWNTCVRFLHKHPQYAEVDHDLSEPLMLE